MLLVKVQWLGTATRYGLEILHQCDKRIKNKSQNVWGANSYLYRSYRGNPPPPSPTPSWIGLKFSFIKWKSARWITTFLCFSNPFHRSLNVFNAAPPPTPHNIEGSIYILHVQWSCHRRLQAFHLLLNRLKFCHRWYHGKKSMSLLFSYAA